MTSFINTILHNAAFNAGCRGRERGYPVTVRFDQDTGTIRFESAPNHIHPDVTSMIVTIDIVNDFISVDENGRQLYAGWSGVAAISHASSNHGVEWAMRIFGVERFDT